MIESSQLPIALEYAPNPKSNFVADWNFNLKGMTTIGKVSRKIVTHVFSQIDKNDRGHIYQVPIAQIIEMDAELSKQNLFREAKTCAEDLSRIAFFISSEEEDSVIPIHFLDTTKKESPSGYKNGVFTVRLNPIVEEWFVNFKQYVTHETKLLFNARSFYTWQFIWALSRWNDSETGKWVVPVEEYERFMDCHRTFNKRGKEKRVNGKSVPKYNSVTKLLDRTTSEPLEELKGTPLEFKIGEHIVDTAKRGSGRKPITHFVFELVRIKPTKIPMEWWGDQKRSECLKKMLNWGISEKKIVEYAMLFRKDIYKIVDEIARENHLSMTDSRPLGKIENITKFAYGVFNNKIKQRNEQEW